MNSSSLRAAFLDADGVLLDSMPQHLRYCADKAREYGLGAQVPSVEAFKRMVRRGVSVSPMLSLFLATGFALPQAMQGVKDYEHEFMLHYPLFRFLEFSKWSSALDMRISRWGSSRPTLGAMSSQHS